MIMNKTNSQNIYYELASYLLIIIFIVFIIPLHLFPCFITGCLSYEIISLMIPGCEKLVGSHRARWLIITIISVIAIIIIASIIINLINFVTSDVYSGINIITEINRIISDIKNRMPILAYSCLPNNIEELKNQISSLIESNIMIIRSLGSKLLHNLITILIGFFMGILISLNKTYNLNTYFINQLILRLQYFSQAFRNVVFAQVKVSFINTILTSIMILIILPILNIYLPLRKTLIIATFIFGLIPILGNIISNIMITISATSISLMLGCVMIIYLISIHKLEFFLNAEIVGNRINAKPWELLLAMLVCEAIFGLEGLVAAPIYYAYLKIELKMRNII